MSRDTARSRPVSIDMGRWMDGSGDGCMDTWTNDDTCGGMGMGRRADAMRWVQLH